ncbi:MAG: efflux RND transporter periplasmic adaptor subunit [Parcubacteria group bacterium]
MKEKIKLVIKAAHKFMKIHKVFSAAIVFAAVVAVIVSVKFISRGRDETKYVLAAALKDSISVSVSGSGTVTAESQVDIKPKVSGDVVYVGVKVGDKVKRGQLIAQIDDENAAKAVRDAELSLENAKLSYEKATKPADALDLVQAENAVFKAEDTLEREITNGYNAVSNAMSVLPGLLSDIHSLVYDWDNGFGISNFTYYKNFVLNDIKNAETTLISTDTNYKKADNLYKEVSSKLIIPIKNDQDELLDYLDSAYAAVKAASNAAQNARSFLIVAQNDFNNRDTDIPLSITADLRTIDGYIASLNTELVSLATRKTALRDAIIAIAEKEDALKDLKDGPDALALSSARLSLSQKENALEDAKEKLANYYIRAPFDGTVAKMNIKNADSVSSDSVSSGSSIATIVTDKSIAEISLNEVDIAKVKTGEKAILDFDAIDDMTITGIVTEVDAVGSSTQGVVSYGAKIAFDVENAQIRSGMNANATIITETKTNAILVPANAVKKQGDTSYVSVVKNPPSELASIAIALTTNPENIPVTIGLQNDDYVEILSGLSEGDVIIERTVTSSSSSAGRTNRTTSGGNQNMMMFGSNGGSAPRMR